MAKKTVVVVYPDSGHNLDEEQQTTAKPTKKFSCGFCDHKSDDQSDIQLHYEQVHLNKVETSQISKHCQRFICMECEKTFFTRKGYGTHQLKEHSKDGRYKCYFCPATFRNKQLRYDHKVRVHK